MSYPLRENRAAKLPTVPDEGRMDNFDEPYEREHRAVRVGTLLCVAANVSGECIWESDFTSESEVGRWVDYGNSS